MRLRAVTRLVRLDVVFDTETDFERFTVFLLAGAVRRTAAGFDGLGELAGGVSRPPGAAFAAAAAGAVAAGGIAKATTSCMEVDARVSHQKRA